MRLSYKNVCKYMMILAIVGFILPTALYASSEGGHGGGHGEEGGESKEIVENRWLLEKEITRHFHNVEGELLNVPRPPKGAAQSKSFCKYCHGSFPHITNRVVRAMFNFHVVFIACETCHYKERLNKDRVGYRWYDGTDRTIKNLLELEAATSSSLAEGPKKKMTTKDIYEKYGFKISPYKKVGDKFVMMEVLTDDPFAQEYFKIQGRLSEGQQAGMKAKIHGKIDPLGSDCIDCHKMDSQLPFKQLGFTETRIKDIVQTEAAGLFKYYSRDPKYKGMTFKIRSLGGIWGIDFKK